MLQNRNYNVGDRDYVSDCNKPDVTSDETNLAIQKYTDQYLKLDFASISYCSTLPRANYFHIILPSSYFHIIATRKNSTRVSPIVKQNLNLGPRFCSAPNEKGL